MTASVLIGAGYRHSSIWLNHCSNRAAYAATTKAGEGRCAEHEGAAVHFEAVCDKWKARG